MFGGSDLFYGGRSEASHWLRHNSRRPQDEQNFQVRPWDSSSGILLLHGGVSSPSNISSWEFPSLQEVTVIHSAMTGYSNVCLSRSKVVVLGGELAWRRGSAAVGGGWRGPRVSSVTLRGLRVSFFTGAIFKISKSHLRDFILRGQRSPSRRLRRSPGS